MPEEERQRLIPESLLSRVIFLIGMLPTKDGAGVYFALDRLPLFEPAAVAETPADTQPEET